MDRTLPIAWLRRIFRDPPRVHPVPEREAPGVRALYYDALPWRGHDTRVFAWLGFPKRKKATPCPGMVLIHGGCGTAFAEWVRLWNSRGYAAIAMDLCGCLPDRPPPAAAPPVHERHPWAGPPGWDAAFDQLDDPLTDQWPYHALADISLAHTLLASDPRVDASRIGMTGISWGGYLTGMAAGLDPRFRMAAPVYGCGFIDRSPAFRPALFAHGSDAARRWLRRWDPSAYLPRARMPMLWLTGTNDFAYPLDAVQKSYRLPRGPRTVSILYEMAHGHGGPGENPEELRVFADSVLNRGAPLPKITGQALQRGTLRVSFTSASPVVKAELLCTRAQGLWEDRKWRPYPAELDARSGTARARLPPHTTVCFINLTDARGCIVSSEHREVHPSG